MPFVFISIAGVLAWLAYLGTGNVKAAGSLLKAELFTNQPPFYKWLGAIILVALLGYWQPLKPIAVALMVLIILSIVLSRTAKVNELIKAL